MLTDTQRQQREVEEAFKSVVSSQQQQPLRLMKRIHELYLRRGLDGLSSSFTSLDASQPWLVYWICNSLCLMGRSIPSEDIARAVMTRFHCNFDGGFGGGVFQLSHLAATYASVMALALSDYEALDEAALLRFFLSLKVPYLDQSVTLNASSSSSIATTPFCFLMQQGGEIDVRGCYCVISVAYLCNILTPELVAGVAEFIGKCQTYEGGFGGVPAAEAHGGYSFCAFATLCILRRFDVIDLRSFERWLIGRQMSVEGGFQGRTNKLADGCYSYWQGALFHLLSFAHKITGFKSNYTGEIIVNTLDWYDREKLIKFILAFCQVESGGFCDRSGSYPDYYHTNYCLAGLSSASYKIDIDVDDYRNVSFTHLEPRIDIACIHPFFGIPVDAVRRIATHFRSKAG